MFLGEYRHQLDDKNRIAVPSKFRSLLKAGAVLTKGLDHCLVLYPRKEWELWAQKVSRLPVSQAKSRAFSRMILGGAMEVEFDKQGRFVLPDYLKEYGAIKKTAVLAGLYDRIELWDVEEWQRYKSFTEKDSTNIAETMASMGV